MIRDLTVVGRLESLNIKSVVTGDVYFMKKTDGRTHRILRAIHHNTTLTRLKKSECKSDNYWFRNESEMKDLFPNSIDRMVKKA